MIMMKTNPVNIASLNKRILNMKIIACITVLAFILAGCTTLKPVRLPQQTLQENISSGGLIQAGDRIQITTIDGKQYEFKVVSIGDGHVKGEVVDLQIKDIAQVKKREISTGKTAGLVGASLLVAISVAVLVAILAFANAVGGGSN
jgi:hypothetical protein